MSSPLISARGLCKSYGDLEVLRNIDVDINRGDVISIIGPSGCGKSTFTRCLNFLDPPTSGEVWFDGKKVDGDPKSLQALRRKMGMVFQSFNLFSNMTIVENAMLGPVNLLGMGRQEAYDLSMDLLETVGLGHKPLAYPDELSGGQKQRAAIARTLAMGPEAIIFDEPTSALDPTMVGEVLGVMMALAEKGTTMLIVTHEMNFAKNVSNRVFYMDEKGIYEDGSPEQIFGDPVRPRTRDFIFHVKTFSYEIRPGSFDFYEMLGQAGAFLRRQLFDDARIQRVFHVLDEAVNHSVLEAGDGVRTLLGLRYTERTDELEVSFTDVSGSAAYPYEGMDELARRVIDGYTKSVDASAGSLVIQM
ncbi:MAG: amino acid ABC transporter ATP-binding protein [Coriobacteriia bacterium]|nr:amino acid ABC transporter ATP-binding protein [Coriobacteriia bacterium]